jgi:predicted oxidoreductase
MKTRRKQEIKFAICITDSEPDLEMRKIYQVVADATAEKEGHVRIIDESGEDYLYPAEFFVSVEVPKEAEQALLITS